MYKFLGALFIAQIKNKDADNRLKRTIIKAKRQNQISRYHVYIRVVCIVYSIYINVFTYIICLHICLHDFIAVYFRILIHFIVIIYIFIVNANIMSVNSEVVIFSMGRFIIIKIIQRNIPIVCYIRYNIDKAIEGSQLVGCVFIDF